MSDWQLNRAELDRDITRGDDEEEEPTPPTKKGRRISKKNARRIALQEAYGLLSATMTSGTFLYQDNPDGYGLSDEDVERVNAEIERVIEGLGKQMDRLGERDDGWQDR